MGKKKGEGETHCRPKRGRMKGRGERLRCGGEGEKMSSDCRQTSPPARETGIFCSISLTSSQFTQEVLPILQQGYLDETSRDYFHYSQATLVNNTRLLNQRNDWLLEMKHKGYTEEELAESFAFLLFDTEDQAKAVCQNGLETGRSDMTTLGDPMKGVYLCKFSDFLHPTPWWHGKQGYILIFKVIKGRVNPVTENYTSDFTSPTPGYDCHISTNSEKVSSKISHFQAFELTQYFLYEIEQCDVQYCPRQIYPYAVVAFRYCDYMCITAQSREIGINAPKIQAVHYYPWKGKLINKSKAVSVALKSSGSALMPVTLPPKLEIDYVIKISELKAKLPPAVFEGKNYMLKEVCLEGLYCSWYELVECLEEEDTPQLGPLLNELKEKNLAIVKCLQDQGFLILFSRSVANSTRESSKTTQCTAQAVFIFKSPRISHLKDAGQVSQPRQSSPFSAKISPLLPAVNYAVAEGLRSAGIQKVPCNKLVEDHLNKYFKMTPDVPPNSCQMGRKAECSLPPVANATACDGEPLIPGNCRESAISQLSPYLSDPASYILSVSAVLELQAKCLKLCQKSGAKAMSPTHASVSASNKAAIALENTEVEEQSPSSKSSLVENTLPRSGRKKRAQKQTKPPIRGVRANVKKTSVTNKPGAGKTFNKSASTMKAESNLVSIRASSRLAAKVDKPGSDGGSNQTASLSLCQLARPRSASGNKRALAEPAKDKSLEKPAPPEVNAKRMKATKVLCKMGSDQIAKAEKAANDCWKEKLSQQHSETGVNTEQISWNSVEGESPDNASASLQPLCLVVIPNETQSKKCSDEGNGNSQKDAETNFLETDALNILADLAISSAIAALPKYKQKRSVSLHMASGKDTSKKTGSVRNNKRSNCSVDLCAKSSACLPGIEPSGPEGHQKGAGEHSKSPLVTESLRYSSDATLAFSSQEALEVPKSPAQVHEEEAPGSLTAPCSSRVLDDHSYSRPPRDRENVYLAVTNPVLSEKEDVVYQSMSVTVEGEKRQPTTFEHQGWTHPEASSRDEERSYEEGTLVGRVLPFRREDSWTNVRDPDPDPQKENDAIAKHPQIPDNKLTDPIQGRCDEAFQQSRYVHEEKNTVKVTFQWNGPYLYQWDSKYTNDPLEKSVNRALHGLWDPTIQETMKDVKLILHMWIGLFYTKSSMMLQNSIRHVQECTESPEAVGAGDLHGESVGVQDPAPDENDSESVVSVQQQEPGASESVIKRIEKNSSLGTSCDCSTPVCGETLPCASPCSEEAGRESDINETVSESAAQTCKGDLVETAKSFAEDEESGNQEPLDDVSDARVENGSQEHNLDQRSTPLSEERHAAETIQYHGVPDNAAGYLLERDEMAPSPAISQAEVTQQDALDGSEESWSSSVTTLTCPVLTVDMTGSVDNEGHSATDSDQLGIIRQSSVIRELHCTKPQAQPASQSIELNSAPASGGCQKLKSKESALNNIGSDYLSDGEKRICEDDLQNIEGTLSAEGDMSQDKFEHLNPTEAGTESFASTKDVQLHSETSEVNSHDCNRSLDARSPVDVTGTAPEKGITGSHVENRAGVQSRSETETQHERTIVKEFVGEATISSDSDSEYLDQMECLPSSDVHRNLMKPIPSQKHLEKQDIHQEEEIGSLNHHDNFDTESEGFDFSCDPSQKAWGSCEEYSSCEVGANSKIDMSAKGFLEDDVPRISHRASCQPLRRKGIRCRKRACYPSNTDSDCGSFRGKRGAINGSLQLRHAERNYLAHSFDKDDECYEMTDSDVHTPVLIKNPNLLGRHQVFQNLSITFQTKPTRSCMCERITRTFYSSERKNFHASPPRLLTESGTSGWSSPIQDIIDLEFIHFSQKVKQLLTRSHTAPCTSIFSMRHGRRTALGRNNVQRGSSEKKTPFTVTIPHQVTGQRSTRCSCNKTQMPELADRDHCLRNWRYKLQQRHKPESYRMYRKRPGSESHGVSCYSNKQMNKMPKKQCPTAEKEFFFVDEQACVMRKKCKELRGETRKQCDSFLTSVSNSFHQSLNEVVKESWKASCKFYVCETNSDPFFKEVKDFLKKEGHVEISLSDLSMIQPHHSGKVLVIIRNEDIAMHLHQIPYLVKLKRMQCVQFAGVDSPRDIKDQTFQELFSSGGFIVSDGTVLDKVTPEYLQQISAVLEKLDFKSKWKWMVHFRELKRLKEMTREESAARRKISLLNQKVEENIVEFLPFHGCDSKSQTKPDYLSCLKKLQVQRISSRFAVFLSGKPENKEIFTQNGIIVLDINNFTKELRNLTTPLQSTYVTENAIRAKEHHTTETQLGLFFGKSTRSQNSEMDQDVF
ncbi:uncharacterized protein [Hemitrygon akajei]|uniref:uncharacterized protein isoform X1 n=1 Tax=Hemitrygon akajei TaxID=2704970 RepID=UPI003BF98D1A